MVMISLSASPAWGPRFLAGWASWLSSRASQCGPKAWQNSSNWQKSSTSRSNMDASPHLMAPTQKEEFKGDKGLASLQTRNSGLLPYVISNVSMIDGRSDISIGDLQRCRVTSAIMVSPGHGRSGLFWLGQKK